MAVMRAIALLMTAAVAEARAKVVAMAAVRAAVMATMALRAMSVVPAEARPMAVEIVVVRTTMMITTVVVAMTVATTMAAVVSAVAAAMVTAEARMTATVVTLLVASGSGDHGNGTTADICDAILPRYTDAVDVRSNNHGDKNGGRQQTTVAVAPVRQQSTKSDGGKQWH
jgi:hypothetical protein